MKISNIRQINEKEVLVKNDKVKMICFEFHQGKGLPNHTHNGMAVIQVVSGNMNISFTNGENKNLTAGDVMEFDARIEHHLIATTFSKIIVTIINHLE